MTWTIATLALGASTDLTFTATVVAPTGAAGEYVNVAEVTAADQFDPDSTPDNDDGDQSEDDEDNASVTPGQADLSLAKSVSMSLLRSATRDLHRDGGERGSGCGDECCGDGCVAGWVLV